MKKLYLILHEILASQAREISIISFLFIAYVDPSVLRFDLQGAKLSIIAALCVVGLSMVTAGVAGFVLFVLWRRKHGKGKPPPPPSYKAVHWLAKVVNNVGRGMAVIGATEDFFYVGIPALLISHYGFSPWIAAPFAVLFGLGHHYKTARQMLFMCLEFGFLACYVAPKYGVGSTFAVHYFRDYCALLVLPSLSAGITKHAAKEAAKDKPEEVVSV